MRSTDIPTIKIHLQHPLLGLGIMYPSPGVVERIGRDWDWLWIDAQHGDMDYRQTADLVKASHWAQVPGLVRIPSHDAGWIGKLLDIGAAGIIVPMVETVQEARAMVAAAKFPPVGNRSYGGRRIIDLQGRGYYKDSNQDTKLILQVESSSACTLAEELAAIEGVDGLFLGPDDLLIRNALDVDTVKDFTNVGPYMQTVSEACKKHQKFCVCVGIGTESLKMAKQFEYDLVVGGSDVGFLASGSATHAAIMRSYFNPILSKSEATTEEPTKLY